ncbi:carbohydrate ABC transporter substrate-binding protein [Rhizobium sp. KVB221]|uniref:Carbohydrate ABC transporter substrate-binding protein n=1 Tax=Rhizobium setariae TaxID=2801340 RepID=A0A937CQA9_9HYPH|nr:ABC transporter substrate-binding protein [Rhizobium setariae]MBL0372787.1 carbohydrate ABC transporter substrate-binding protein [Rhizobium setariae]
MKNYRALTWDHPRGYHALAAASDVARGEKLVDIVWDKHPLEGFESHPIAELCEKYDLVVLDHPHVGEAVAENCLQPLESIFSMEVLAKIGQETIGPCLESYFYDGSTWALPLDAATQVMAVRPELLDGPVPVTWADVAAFSERSGKVALSLAGPHAALSFLSVCASLGEEPGRDGNEFLVSEPVGEAAFDLMARLAAKSLRSVMSLNPIGILAHMASQDDVALCPLIYGYVNYSAPKSGNRVSFHNAPREAVGGRPGSTLGGTGIGISKRCEVTPDLKHHLLWLMSSEAQSRFIPGHEGQPSQRSAWHDGGVNGAWGDFYRNTADTLEAAYVRPRFNGYIGFQAEASAILRDAFENRQPAAQAVLTLNDTYRKALERSR